jgi:hypothetical protein
MTPTTTAPARLTAEWFKLGAIVVTTFVVCWTLAIGYWHITDHNPETGELALTLFALPLSVCLAFWGAQKAITARAAIVAEVKAKPATSSSQADAASASAPVLAIVATALRSPHGTSAEELASAIADNAARADLDKELVDDNGFPVMTARSEDAHDEALQDEIADWLSSQGLQVHLSEEQWRALTLASGVAAELGSMAASDLLPYEENPPTLQLRSMLPTDWPIDIRRAVTMWLKHTVSQYGWPEASISVPEVPEQDHASPATVITQLIPKTSSDTAPAVALVIACASLIGQDSIDRLAAQSALFTSSQSRGQIPGEGAAGMLLTDLKLAHACGAEFTLLGPINERRRDTSADDTRRVDSTLLLELTQQLSKAAAVDMSQINMVVADTAHRPNRVLELMGLSAPAIPQVDAADDIVRIGLGSGSCGAVPFVTVLALARHYALERGAPVLCIGNEDPYLRSATLVRPPA